MKASDYTFSGNEIEKLKEYRDRQDNFCLKIRMTVLLMLACGSDTVAVASVLGKSGDTVKNWFRKYLAEGADSLNSKKYKLKQPYLTGNRINQVIIWVTYETPEDTKDTREYIRIKFGVTYAVEAVRQLLQKHGLKVIWPDVIPGNPPGAEEQKQFIRKYFKLRTCGDVGSVVLFGDAMHLIHQNVPGRCRGDPKFPPVSESDSGRKRLNILGAYNPYNHSFIRLTGEENCDAERITDYPDLIMKCYRNTSRVDLIVDNAKYFYARKVTEWLGSHKKMNLIFLPSYAPNLSLIERFWRFAKDKLVRNKYYTNFIRSYAAGFVTC